MRPGFYTRKSDHPAPQLIVQPDASMRPGFYTRKSKAGRRPVPLSVWASMRPGFYTRKSAIASILGAPTTGWRGFNEAGILHPEKPHLRRGMQRKNRRGTRFNEAGILHPEKRGAESPQDGYCTGFNEAGILHPEKPPSWRRRQLPIDGFNEAGILHPEKQNDDSIRRARAGCAASMRPGFYTRKSAADPVLRASATGVRLQ